MSKNNSSKTIYKHKELERSLLEVPEESFKFMSRTSITKLLRERSLKHGTRFAVTDTGRLTVIVIANTEYYQWLKSQ